jgi:CO/xanthine dehydrogenase FAD-binding subunit
MVETCYIPKDFAEALRVRKETGAKPIAGGTDLMVVHRRGTGIVPRFPWPVMIITQLQELKGIHEEDGEISIYSGSTCHEIEASEVVPYQVRKAASLMGAQSLRNLATIGGNVCNASPKGDLPVPLIMLDARVELISATGVRQLLLDDFITGPKTTALQDDELLSRIIIPKPEQPFTYLWYRKIGTRRANAISKLSMCAAVTLDLSGNIIDFRSANGASGPKVARSRSVEELIIGTSVDTLPDILPRVLDAYDGILSPHAMPQYRRSSTRRMLAYFLTEVGKRPAEQIIQ